MLPQRLLFSRTFSEDPYTVYAELRESGPVHPIDFLPGPPPSWWSTTSMAARP